MKNQVITFNFTTMNDEERTFSHGEILDFINNDGMIDPTYSPVSFHTESDIIENDEDVIIEYEDSDGQLFYQTFYDFLSMELMCDSDGYPLLALRISANG